MAVVHQVPRIKRAFVVTPKSDDEDILIKTDGVNINAMFDYADVLDLNRLYCNDIHAVVEHYGVEAASRVIVKVLRFYTSSPRSIGNVYLQPIQEVNNVFKVYGITVDPRHLSLVASFMTSGGGYRAFSRVGMADCTSPLQQMTYETATEFLKNATLQGNYKIVSLKKYIFFYNFVHSLRSRKNGFLENALISTRARTSWARRNRIIRLAAETLLKKKKKNWESFSHVPK